MTHRVLIVDDNLAIHADFAKLLAPDAAEADAFAAMEAALLGEGASAVAQTHFNLAFASQGLAAIELVRAACAEGRPFEVAFVDMRMPPGIDGLETIERLYAIDPALQICVCSAYSDYRWTEIRARLGERDGLLVIKKPFEPIEIVQCAHALSAKWHLARENATQVAALKAAIARAQKLEAVGRLAAGISHEINNPLQYVTASLSYLRDLATDYSADTAAFDLADFFTVALPDALASIELGVGKIAAVSNAMRTLSHPGGGPAAPADLNSIVEGALALTRPTYANVADAELELSPLPPVPCHASELGQVFVNLIVNATHAMEALRPRRGKLRVSSRVAGPEVEIAISDTGVGIPVEARDRIFDAFFTTKEVGKGTGQGLAISREVVCKHHAGTLTFATELGAGTTFFVRLPIDPSAAAPSRLGA